MPRSTATALSPLFATSLRRVMTTVLMAALAAALPAWNLSQRGLDMPPDDDWVRIHDAAAQFSVELPGSAPVRAQTMSLPSGEDVAARTRTVELDDDGALAITVIDAAGLPIDLSSGISAAAGQLGGRVEGSTAVRQDGRRAMDATIAFRQGGTDGTAFMRVIDAGGNVILLGSLGASDDEETLARVHERMLDSLHIRR